jgi:microcystin-dependent protein
MGTPFLGELKLVAFNFAPKGWATCDGAMMQINQNQALFALLGTHYGGNGSTTFGLPDLRGRIPVHASGSYIVGAVGGEPTHTLTMQEIPAHNHVVQGTNGQGTTPIAQAAIWANATVNAYAQPQPPVAVHQATVTPFQGSAPHENMAPFTALLFCIALVGIFPSQN